MLKKRTARFAGIAVALGLLFPALSATAKDKVVIGELNWPGAVAIEQVLGEVISTRLGGDVSGFVHPAVQQALRQRWRDSDSTKR